MVSNDRYVGEHGAELKYVLNSVHVLRGERTPGKRFLLNISICALPKKWKFKAKPGAKT
jgi:hypothetical protein